MKPPRIKVPEKIYCWCDFEGDIDQIINDLQKCREEGWEKVVVEYYGYDGGRENYLLRYREETDEEYTTRLEQIKEKNILKAKKKVQRLEKLKKELESLSPEEKQFLNL